MSSFLLTISRAIFFRLLAHAPEELQREAKENARGAIPALCFTEDDIRKKFAQEELWDELSDDEQRVSIAKLSSLEPGNKRLDLCGVSRILVRIFLHKRRRRFYAARRSEARASEPFLLFSSSFPASTRWFVGIDDFRIRCAPGSGY